VTGYGAPEEAPDSNTYTHFKAAHAGARIDLLRQHSNAVVCCSIGLLRR
jgi:hypothetical protein